MAITRVGGGAVLTAGYVSSQVNPTLSPALNVTTTSGDIALVYVAAEDADDTCTVSISGYTKLYDHTGVARELELWAKVCGASEGDPTVTLTGTHTNLSVHTWAEVIRGAHQTLGELLAHVAETNNTSQTALNYASLTITTNGCYVGILGLYRAAWTSSTIASPPADLTERVDSSTTLAGDCATALWTGVQTTAANITGSTIAITGGGISTSCFSFTFALKPSTGTAKYLKALTHSSAAGITVAGTVFNAPDVGDITGSKIGEFSGIAFLGANSLDGGKAKLLVNVESFGGSSLTTANTPQVYLRTSSFDTSMFPATVIEV